MAAVAIENLSTQLSIVHAVWFTLSIVKLHKTNAMRIEFYLSFRGILPHVGMGVFILTAFKIMIYGRIEMCIFLLK